MNNPGSQVITIRALDIKNLAIAGLAFGFLSGIFSVAFIAYLMSTAPATPNWIELEAIMISIKRATPVAIELIYAWPVISALGNALGFTVVGLIYNLIALRAPIKVRVST